MTLSDHDSSDAHDHAAQAEQHQRLHDRVELLKLRTALVGILGFLLLAMALTALLSFGPQALSAISSLWAGEAQVQVPANLFANMSDTSRWPLVLQLAFLAVAGLGVSAMSRGAMSPLHRKLWLVLLFGLGGAALAMQLSGEGNRAARGHLESALKKQDWAEASKLLPVDSNAIGAAYVQAQIALAQGDAAAARVQGLKFLPDLEQALLRKHPDGPKAGGYLYEPTRDFRALTLKRIDEATYGGMHSEVSIRLQQGQSAAPSGWLARGAKPLLSLAAALVAVCVAALLLLLWYAMVHRVQRVSTWASMGDFRV